MKGSKVSRRAFLGTALSAPLAHAAVGPRRAPVIDTHVHCFAGRADARFPYHANAPYRPEAASTPADLLRAMSGAGVNGTVIVHPEPYQDDHRYLEHCLALDRTRLKGTCLFFADRPGAPGRMNDLAGRCALVALRIHAYAPERLPPFGKPELRALWRQAGELGLAVQLHLEPRGARLRAAVIIDHLGSPFQGTPREHAVVVGWARYPNTVMKLSSLAPPERYPHREVGPIVRRLADAWGPDRLIYGGGYAMGASAKEYRGARERLAGFLTHLSASERDRVLGGNAARLFRFAV